MQYYCPTSAASAHGVHYLLDGQGGEGVVGCGIIYLIGRVVRGLWKVVG